MFRRATGSPVYHSPRIGSRSIGLVDGMDHVDWLVEEQIWETLHCLRGFNTSNAVINEMPDCHGDHTPESFPTIEVPPSK